MDPSPQHKAPKRMGRPRLNPDEPTVAVVVRLPVSLRAKFNRLGGSPWVRRSLARAKEE